MLLCKYKKKNIQINIINIKKETDANCVHCTCIHHNHIVNSNVLIREFSKVVYKYGNSIGIPKGTRGETEYTLERIFFYGDLQYIGTTSPV